MRDWVVASSAAAPVSLIGGWTWAATRQPAGYDPLRDTISALAARNASDRWIMTTGLALLGACHVLTALGFTDLGTVARLVLGAGGAATIVVAALPQPSAGHVPAATVGFVTLALWPASARWTPRREAVAATGVLLVLLAWLAYAAGSHHLVGLAERVLAGAQALCPVGFVLVTVRCRTP